jgi:hypothetical protein
MITPPPQYNPFLGRGNLVEQYSNLFIGLTACKFTCFHNGGNYETRMDQMGKLCFSSGGFYRGTSGTGNGSRIAKPSWTVTQEYPRDIRTKCVPRMEYVDE